MVASCLFDFVQKYLHVVKTEAFLNIDLLQITLELSKALQAQRFHHFHLDEF